jgi:hypothetical protein
MKNFILILLLTNLIISCKQDKYEYEIQYESCTTGKTDIIYFISDSDYFYINNIEKALPELKSSDQSRVKINVCSFEILSKRKL